MVPLILVGIGKVETLLHLLKADTVTTMVAIGLRMVGVLYVDVHFRAFDSNSNMYETRFRGADTMLESILNQRDTNQG